MKTKHTTIGNTPQTVIVLPNIRFMLRAPMSDVPNQEGYKLLGCLPNGLALPLTVAKDGNGCHYLKDQFGSHRLPSGFDGWVKDESDVAPKGWAEIEGGAR
jgi:hypothetical protein